MACMKGHAAVANLLINEGADVHAVNDYKNTSLIYAAGGLESVCLLLINKGTDIHVAKRPHCF